MKQNIQTLKGFRDFLPQERAKRDLVMGKIVEVFKSFNFLPLETPTLEYADVLLGKYGDEADKLVYTFTDKGGRQVGLRYDQTVPTARVLAQYKNQLPKYFRRYQIQNVFRADKPQKRRYREFTQCDIDIFGTSSPIADAEIIACTYEAIKNIGFSNFSIKLNDRQVLMNALAPLANESVSVASIISSIDKLDKQSEYEVEQELINKGMPESVAKQTLETIASAEPSDNLAEIVSNAILLGVPQDVMIFEPNLARGLDYYTGMIMEVVLPDAKGSIAGGGRYDKLIGQLGGEDTLAVGIAFGFDRLVEAASEYGLISNNNISKKTLVTIFDDGSSKNSLEIVNILRTSGISAEVYPEAEKLGKQLKYSSDNKFDYAVIIGPDEIKNEVVKLKDLAKKTEETLSIQEVIEKLI